MSHRFFGDLEKALEAIESSITRLESRVTQLETKERQRAGIDRGMAERTAELVSDLNHRLMELVLKYPGLATDLGISVDGLPYLYKGAGIKKEIKREIDLVKIRAKLQDMKIQETKRIIVEVRKKLSLPIKVEGLAIMMLEHLPPFLKTRPSSLATATIYITSILCGGDDRRTRYDIIQAMHSLGMPASDNTIGTVCGKILAALNMELERVGWRIVAFKEESLPDWIKDYLKSPAYEPRPTPEPRPENIVDIGEVDPRTCLDLRGILDERGHCLVKIKQDAREPSVVKSLQLKEASPPERTVILKVTYLGQLGMGWEEEVSRVVELKETQILVDLHKAIFESTRWDEMHLYSFFMDNRAWTKDKSKEFTAPEIDESMLDYKPNSANIELKSLNLHPRQRFLYVFDFGDCHHFSVKVKGFGEAKKGVEYPRFVHEESVGKFPPQYPE